MNPQLRIVVRLPLENLWNAEGVLDATKQQELSESDMRALLKNGPVSFAIANTGLPLVWMPPEECYGFWKAELQPHLFHPDRRRLEDYPGEYYYVAHQWLLQDGEQIIVREKHH